MIIAIEQTKRELYRCLALLKQFGKPYHPEHMPDFEDALEAHLELQRQLIQAQREAIADLHMTKRALVGQVEQLVQDNDLLTSAARIAGDELREYKTEVSSGPFAVMSALNLPNISGRKCSHSMNNYGRCVFCLELHDMPAVLVG